MTDIRIRLDGPPRGKGRPRFRNIRTKDGRAFVSTYTDSKTVSYETALAMQATLAMAGQSPLSGALRVSVFAGMPIPKSWSHSKRRSAVEGRILPTVKPDVDNTLKLLDALNKIVWIDDNQIVNAEISKRYAEQPYLLVVVRPLESIPCQPVPAAEAGSSSRKSVFTDQELPLGGPPPISISGLGSPRSLSG